MKKSKTEGFSRAHEKQGDVSQKGENKLKELEEIVKRRRADNADYFENVHQSKRYARCCRKWAKLDYWPPSDAAHLLAGLHPEGPEIPGRSDLAMRVRQITSWLEHTDLPTDRRTNEKYKAKEIIKWAKKKDLDVPEALLKAMNPTKQKPNESPHGNALRFHEDREKVLGAAINAIIHYPEQCKGTGNKITGSSIASFIETHPRLFFEAKVPPLKPPTMAKLINKYLRIRSSN